MKTIKTMETMEHEWAKEMNCNVTVCDTEGTIVYMNDKSLAKLGDLVGKNLLECHNPHSRAIILELLATGGSNAYTIEKNGNKRMVYQTAWRTDGVVSGLVELAMDIPEVLPHYIRFSNE
ncbi:MAG: PAS sensor protein [Bacteroides sp.]